MEVSELATFKTKT